MEKSKKYTLIVLPVIIFISALILSFYWFQYLPHKIERDCSDNLLARAVELNNRDFYNINLKPCINSGGYKNYKEIVNSNIKPKEEEQKEARPALIITD